MTSRTPQQALDLATDALQRLEALKREFARTRVDVQAARDAVTQDMIADAMRTNHASGVEIMSGLAKELMDAAQRLTISCDPLERIWWDKKRRESTVML